MGNHRLRFISLIGLVAVILFSLVGFIYYKEHKSLAVSIGGSWVQINDPFPPTEEPAAIAADPVTGDLWLSSIGGGVAVSSNEGNTWTIENNGLSVLKVNRIGFNSLGDP